MFDFDAQIDRKASDSIKWRKYHDRDIIPMWVADMDFASPPAVVDALHRRVSHGVFGYAMPSDDLADTICNQLQTKYKWRVSPEWLVWLPGLVSGLNVACRSLGSSDSTIVTTIPVYPPFLSAPANMGMRLLTSPMVNADDRWQLDFDHLSQSLAQDGSMFLLCNPHNPTGRMFHRKELMRLAELCLSHDLIICSDEIHCDLVLEAGRQHVPMATLDDEIARRTITLMAPSKTFNIPGLGCAFAVISDDGLRRRFQHAMSGIVPHVNVMGLTAAQAAFQEGNDWLKDLLMYLKANRDMVQRRINQLPGLQMASVEATYLAWIDTRLTGIAQPQRFFSEHGVGLSDGKDFDGPGFVRLNFGCQRTLLSKALNRMSDAISTL